MTQHERVIQYLREKKSITSKEAFIDLSIMDLPKIISDLRKQGWQINRESCSALNQFRERVHFKKYSFVVGQTELNLGGV